MYGDDLQLAGGTLTIGGVVLDSTIVVVIGVALMVVAVTTVVLTRLLGNRDE